MLRQRLVHGKSVGLYGSLMIIGLFLFVWLRISRLSRLKDLGSSRFRELNLGLSRLPIVEESRDSWTRTRIEKTIILSAYLDPRPEVVLEEDSSLAENDYAWAVIRIIGIVPVKMKKSRPICHYRYKTKEDYKKSYTFGKESIAIRLSAFQENFGMAHCAAYVLCELPKVYNDSGNFIELPYSITITSDTSVNSNDLEDEEFIAIRYPKNGWNNATASVVDKTNRSNDNNIAVCVQPLHHQFDEALDLMAFVEFYRMMGVERFTFYRDSVSSRVNHLLDHYMSNGVATIIDWKLPDYFIYERNLRVDGIFAALNDCLYRSSFHDSYRYVVGVDIDEYIVPRKHDNFHQMMQYLNSRRNNELTGGWIFRNMFFYLMHPDDSITLRPGIPSLKLHTKTARWQIINRPRDRSKFIVQARDVIDLGNHHVWQFKRAWSIFGTRYREVAVDPEIAGSHHYRKCETKVETCWQRPTEIDRTAHRFTAQLGERVANISRIVFRSSGEKYSIPKDGLP